MPEPTDTPQRAKAIELSDERVARLEATLRDLGELITVIRQAGFPTHREDECFCDTCWSYLVEDAR